METLKRQGRHARLIPIALLAALSLASGARAERVDVYANAFREGGWKLDVQFMDVMGSPYLLAHGMGSPVPDAVATVSVPTSGKWRVWARTRKWVDGAGAFRVLADGKALAHVFGRGDPAWGWEDGGEIELAKGPVEIRLRDEDGFDGRCAGLVLASAGERPEGALNVLDRKPEVSRSFDFVVVGGGLPGCCAAIAAARRGLKVALVQDRPVAGGNASGEVRVWSTGEIRYPLVNEVRSKFMNTEYENVFSDSDRTATLEREPNLSLFFFHRAFGVEKRGACIAAVKALDVVKNRVVEFRAPHFCDATGDGWVGFWAGAEWRYGREGRDETGEKYAPEKGDRMTLGSSIMWKSAMATYDVPFSAPWAEPYACGLAKTSGNWNWEFGLKQDILAEGEAVRDRVLLAIYGAFSNAKKNPSNTRLKLVTCPFVLGKRETRRLMGDQVFCEQDITEKRLFDDAVATGSWSIDLHYTIDEKIPFLTRCEQPRYGRYWIPYRSLYSRNVQNLFLAGRCFSCTHVGLGSPRVMNTLSQLGCAVGEAAAMCVKGGYSPRELYTKGHARELQRNLGGDFPGNPDPARKDWRYVDDESAGVKFKGKWRQTFNEFGGQYGDKTSWGDKGAAISATYPLPVEKAGRYLLKGIVPHLFYYRSAPSVELIVRSGGRESRVEWNQLPGSGFWCDLGTFDLQSGATLEVRRAKGCHNKTIAADGFAIVPVAVQPPVAAAFERTWTKYEGNPVLGNARLGTCFDVNVITNGPAPFTMYFSWRPKGAIAFVRSEDGFTWTQEPEICLPPKPEHAWERIVNRTCTVRRGDVWHMWYTGQDTKKKNLSRIGYATSKDGIHFERASDEPVLVAEAPYEQPSVMNPSVMWDEARQIWRMWYSAGNTYEPDCNCYAESKDGIHWQKYAGNPVLAKGDRESWERDRVAGCEVHRLPDGRYAMFYIGYSDVDTARIGAAISKDGITGWKRLAQNPLVAPDLGRWDACACYKPSVFRDEKNNRWLLWYNGRNGRPEYVGMAIRKGLDLEVPPERLPDPKSLLEKYVKTFNDCDSELYTNAIPNAVTKDFLVQNIPYFACSDKEIEQAYYFRWWTFRKHIRKDLGCWTISEFLPNVPWAGAGNMIVCAVGHHLREGRWLRDPQYIVSDAKYWLTDARAKNRWDYSSWLFSGVRQIAELHALDQLPGELLDSAVAVYRRWEQGFKRGKRPMGGDGKGGFLSIDDREGTEMSLGGNGYKPLFTSAMWSEANAIAEVAKRCGRRELAAEFAVKADVVAKSLNANCWNPEVGFYTTATREGQKGTVRELHGYAPWYFGAPVDGHAADWAQLADAEGFAARYGLTFPERRAPGFALAYKGHECQWNGPSWPYSTSVALTAYLNDLHATKDEKVRTANNFAFLVWQYAESHRCLMADRTMAPWIDENLNPDKRDWISRTVIKNQKMKFPRERGKDYNHSTFCDLVISGLVGIVPNGAKGFVVDPLCPATWDYFILDHLLYRGHEVSVRWHRGHGGLTVKVDGREVACRETLGRLDVSL